MRDILSGFIIGLLLVTTACVTQADLECHVVGGVFVCDGGFEGNNQ